MGSSTDLQYPEQTSSSRHLEAKDICDLNSQTVKYLHKIALSHTVKIQRHLSTHLIHTFGRAKMQSTPLSRQSTLTLYGTMSTLSWESSSTISFRFLSSRHDSAAYEGNHCSIQLTDTFIVQILTHGRLHAGSLAIKFFDKQGHPCSLATWRDTKPVLSATGTFIINARVAEVDCHGLRIKLYTKGRSYYSVTVELLLDPKLRKECKYSGCTMHILPK